MKLLILILAASSLSKALEENGLQLDLENTYEDQFLKDEMNLRFDAAGITARLNEFADKVFKNIGNYAVNHNFDPYPINDLSENYLLASIAFTNGNIRGISTIKRYENVSANYQSSLKLLTLELPIQFSNLSFTYDYLVKLTGLKYSGDLIGQVKNFRMNLQLNFEFKTLTANIGQLKTTNSGNISFTIHGNVTDAIFNIISHIVTAVLQPMLQLIVEGMVKNVANKLVNEVNEIIYNITHQNDTLFNNEFQQIYLG